MSEDEARVAQNEEQGDEVEGHMRSPRANDEGETEGDEVEAHTTRPSTPKTL